MRAPVEVQRCSASLSEVQKHFADLDIKKASLHPTPPSAPVRVESNPIPPPADELAERLAELERLPQTPKVQDLRPVPLTKSNSKVSDGGQTHQDSGYASIASSPEGLEPEKSREPGFSSSKLRVFERPIPEYLQHRFYDLKVLYSEDLLRAVYKKNVDQKDLSMKLKYLGKSEPSAQLYIVVQCEAKFAKKVKKFFAQNIVQEYMDNDFKLHVINRPPRGLASAEEIAVYGLDSTGMTTMCGQPIMLSNGETSVFATLGGIVQVSKPSDEMPQLYGFTAAHSLLPLIRQKTGSLGDDISDTSDEDDDFMDEDDDILFELPSEDEWEEDSHPFNIQNAAVIGNIVANSVDMPTNRDWSLVSLSQQLWLPNLVHPQSPSRGSEHRFIYFSAASLPYSYSTSVLVATCHGTQHGSLETGKSFLFSSPGAEFTQTFDLKLEGGYGLRPGDSGSWVVDSLSGRVLGHVASIDAFGEAFVVPLHETLGDIREALNAASVSLPSQDDINKLQSRTEIRSSTSQPEEAAIASLSVKSVSSTSAIPPQPSMIQNVQRSDSSTQLRLTDGTLVNTDTKESSNESVSGQSNKLDQGPSSPPPTKGSKPDPARASKKNSSVRNPKSRLGDIVAHITNRFIGKPMPKPTAKPPIESATQYSMQPYGHTPYGQPAAMVYESMIPSPYYLDGTLKLQHALDPHDIYAYAAPYPQMHPMSIPPPQAIAELPAIPVEQDRAAYVAQGHIKGANDSGYSSLQPSAQCSPAPSPPSPGQSQ
ncbi:hypothetical protein NLU13_7389 [Sarocladium strictum]|uniref:Uncharacterized protein n=1 Tax=Sarocladium strictum TaxID=5046 RepID=A0AA39GCP6_SARSR|nr:hypothetical protein NLU13_7389 [Sarocladium strictum]